MEDPESEWKILEYSSSKNDNVIKRILTNGYVIGKEIVSAGIVIASAQLVVPPLVVFSAVGVAVSVPFGVLFASYACTNKLMSMLLSTPPPPMMLEYYYYTDDGFEQENDERMECKLGFDDCEDDAQVEGYVTDHKEDNEQMEDHVNQRVIETEIGFGLELGLDDDDDDDDYRQEGETLIANKEMEDDMLQREREEIEDVKQGVEMRPSFGDVGNDGEGGYEGDVGEYLEGDDGNLEEPLVESQNDVDESNAYEVNEESNLRGEGTVEDDCIVNESASNVVFREATSESASNVVFEDVKDVETTKPVTSESASNVVFGDVKDVEITEPVTSESASNVVFGDVKDVEITELVTSESASNVVFGDVENHVGTTASDVVFGDVKNVGTTEPVTTGEVAASNVVFGDDKHVETAKPVTVIEIESEKLVEKGSKNEEPIGEMRHVVILSNGNEENNYNSKVVDELDLVAREAVGDANKGERNIESEEKVLRESMGTQGGNGGDASKDEGEDAILKTLIEEHLIHSINNVDAREIGEENWLDERNANNNLESLEVDNEVKENAAGDNVDILARNNAKATYKKMSSRLEEKLDEEKIWEKIAAMRRIVGYKAPSQPTCIGELKALYVFTGVEPPASFDADSDMDAKLKFLMAIVGIK